MTGLELLLCSEYHTVHQLVITWDLDVLDTWSCNPPDHNHPVHWLVLAVEPLVF